MGLAARARLSLGRGTYYLFESQLSKGNVVDTVKSWILAQAEADALPVLEGS